MNRDQITPKVIQLAAEQVGVDPGRVTPATHFVNDLEYDSLDKVNFAMNLEDAFNISIPDEQAETVQTVGETIDKVIELLQNRQAA